MSKFISIDLAPDGIFVVSGSARGGHTKIDHAFSWTEADGAAPPALSRETARQIGEQLRDRMKSAGMSPAPALVSIARGRVILKELRYPAVPPTEEPALVKFQALKELTDSPDEVVLDYTPLSNGSAEGERLSMAVVIRRDLYTAVQQLCAAANLRLAAVTPRPYAVAAGLGRAFHGGAISAPDAKSDAVAALVLSPAGGEFTVVRNGEVTYTSEVPGPVITSEPMLLGDVRRKLTVYAGGSPGHPVQGVYVAEAGGNWAGRLRSALSIPVQAYDPLAGAVPQVPEPLRGSFAGAVGLLAARAADAISINFAAPRQPRVETDPRRTQMLLAVLAAMILVFVGGIYGYFTLDAADDKIASLKRKKDDLEKERQRLEPDTKRLDAANKWKARRVNWLDELFDMTDRFQSSDRFYAMAFEGHALAPDVKTAAQPQQARMDVRLASRSLADVNAIIDALSHTESKYYVGTGKTFGSGIQGDPQAKEYTIFTRVIGRAPDRFTRAPAFTPPVRKNYPPRSSPARDSREAKEPSDDPGTAPDPKIKEEPDDPGQ